MAPKSPRTPRSRPPLDRMLKIHRKLSNHELPTCPSLAREFEVSQKTIQRDIEWMRDSLALPIRYSTQDQGYIYTETVAEFPTLQVSENDLVALLLARRALEAYAGTPLYAALEHAFERLGAGLKHEVSFSLGALDQTYSFKGTGMTAADTEVFRVLGQAVREHREIAFEYQRNPTEPYQSRQLRPYHLACVNQQWYVVGHCLLRAELRTFALPRMRAVALTDKRFTVPPDFDIQQHLKGALGIFKGRGHHRIRLRFVPAAAGRARERHWHPSQQLEDQPDGSVILSLELDSLEELTGWVLSWQTQVEVLEPPELRSRLREFGAWLLQAPLRHNHGTQRHRGAC